MSKPLSPARAVAFHLRDLLPASFAAFADINKEVAQTTTWLVTLGTGLLTFLAVNRTTLDAVSPTALRWALSLLFVATITGVVQRLAQLQVIRLGIPHNLQLQSWVTIGVTEAERPPADGDLETKEDIIAHLERFMGGDFAFLRAQGFSMAAAKSVYDAMHDLWKEREVQTFENLGKLIGAYQGQSTEAGQTFLNAEQDIDAMRRTGRTIRHIVYASIALFLISFGSFIAAIMILAASMLSRLAAA
jgi:hypothetical protein